MIAENNPEMQVKHGGGGHNEDTNVITAEDEIALIYTVRGGEPYKIPLKINDRFIEFEIDTGAGRTIISENIYRDNLKHIPLVWTAITLKTYSGENLKVIGKILVTLRHEETVVEEYIYRWWKWSHTLRPGHIIKDKVRLVNGIPRKRYFWPVR